MVDYSKFIDKSAPLERAIRYDTCPFCKKNKKAFVVIPKKQGFLLWCHYCHEKRWILRGKRSPNQVKKMLVKKQQTSKIIYLPKDFKSVLPPDALVWLYRYGITEEQIKHFKMGYSEQLQRLIIPFYKDGVLIYWTGRYTKDYKSAKVSKYINRTRYGNSYWVNNPLASDEAVIVEDALSAICVGAAGYAAVCLFGSYISDSVLQELSKKFSLINVWLDPDKRSYTIKIKKRGDAFGLKLRAILKPKKDPKDFSIPEIKEILCV